MRRVTQMILSAVLACSASSVALADIQPGDQAPNFTLTDHRGQSHTLSQYRGQVVLLDFWSAKCPVSERYEDRLKALAAAYGAKGVVTLGIDSNKNDTVDEIQAVTAGRQVPFPIVIDPGNKVADLYGGRTTPHVYIVNAEGQVVYQGAIDDEGLMGQGKVQRHFAAEALDAVLSGGVVSTATTEPFGCSIKRVSP